MTIDEIRELINLTTETGIAELEVERGGERVHIRRAAPAPEYMVMAQPPLPRTDIPSPAPSAPPPKEEPKETGTDPNLILVRSPIVGTFYEASAPGAPPFVRVGEHVHPGKVLCIIESMKLMNEIEAEISGVIESKLVMNGQPVEYGEAMFAIRAH
jgi:acetyl-CoA carboxylase biotin carboxyl carrier protein